MNISQQGHTSNFSTKGVSDLIFANSFELLGTCTLTISPGDNFVTAFAQLSAGGTLCLSDGVYQQAMDIPSNINVRAVNDGMAEIDGISQLGVQWNGGLVQMQGDNSSVRGLRVHHAHRLANTCNIRGTNNTMRVMSCSHGGTHEHKIPLLVEGSGHLIEDSWFYGEGRQVVRCFVGDNITFRRNVSRWDSTAPDFPSEPNSAFINYNCSYNLWENNISLDYGVPESRMRFGADFSNSNNKTIYPTGNIYNQWLGNIAINHALDTDNRRAFQSDANHADIQSGNIMKDFYARDNSAGFAIKFNFEFEISNCTMINIDNIGNYGGQPIECNGDADIQFRYIDGVKSSESLWPWSNEALIKRDMCDQDERQSDWCLTNKSLTEYVLEL